MREFWYDWQNGRFGRHKEAIRGQWQSAIGQLIKDGGVLDMRSGGVCRDFGLLLRHYGDLLNLEISKRRSLISVTVIHGSKFSTAQCSSMWENCCCRVGVHSSNYGYEPSESWNYLKVCGLGCLVLSPSYVRQNQPKPGQQEDSPPCSLLTQTNNRQSSSLKSDAAYLLQFLGFLRQSPLSSLLRGFRSRLCVQKVVPPSEAT